MEAGSVQCVRFLLDHGADSSLQNHKKSTPIHTAVEFDQPDVITVNVTSHAMLIEINF